MIVYGTILENLSDTVHIANKGLEQIKDLSNKLEFINYCIELANILLDMLYIFKQELKKESLEI